MFTLLAYWVAGCSCRELPPTTADDTEDTVDTSHTAAHSAHSAVDQGPCPQPEVEPNDGFDEAQALLLEQGGCGAVDPQGDRDYWTFDLEDDAWLLVEVQAADGSISNPTVLVTPDGGGWAASRNDDPDDTDVHLRFPAPAGDYFVTVSEQTLLGGERYGYDLLVSESKPPVEWTRTEVEPNDSSLLAEPLASDEVVFGGMDGNGPLPDFDWYRVIIPAGKHTLSFEVTSYEEGAGADLTVLLWDDALEGLPEGCRQSCPPDSPTCVPCAFEGGVPGVELDPFGSYDSDGNEIVWLQVLEAGNREGPANWYVLHVRVEGS
jgi:hypothetical protein